MPPDTASYDTDFYTWTQTQAALLDARQFDTLDLPNLVEEILSLGINHKHALASHLRNLLLHLLKWRYHPHRRQTGRSWQVQYQQRPRRDCAPAGKLAEPGAGDPCPTDAPLSRCAPQGQPGNAVAAGDVPGGLPLDGG